MLKKSPTQKQGSFLYQDSLDQLNPKDPLLLLAKNIPRESFKWDFAPLHSLAGKAGTFDGGSAFVQADCESERREDRGSVGAKPLPSGILWRAIFSMASALRTLGPCAFP